MISTKDIIYIIVLFAICTYLFITAIKPEIPKGKFFIIDTNVNFSGERVILKLYQGGSVEWMTGKINIENKVSK